MPTFALKRVTRASPIEDIEAELTELARQAGRTIWAASDDAKATWDSQHDRIDVLLGYWSVWHGL